MRSICRLPVVSPGSIDAIGVPLQSTHPLYRLAGDHSARLLRRSAPSGRRAEGYRPSRRPLRWVHIVFPAASPLTASRDFVTWSAGEILSSSDEKTATILESGAMTNVVRSV